MVQNAGNMQKKRTEKESVKAENNTFLLAFEPFFR